jgi:serine/threonine protein kinase/tetratricopeptide (TPR) repeat protein
MDDESLFAAALGKATETERRAFLEQACAGDVARRRRVERLLSADEQTHGILERGPGPSDLELSPPGPPLRVDRIFAGRFRLREKLGEGGMGEVWVAEQLKPVQRRVALKVVRPGFDSARLIARFDQERQALALMDHPNIAKVLDAGIEPAGTGPESAVAGREPAGPDTISETNLANPETGRPYFVMELIKGVPITQYCDDAKSSPRERLELFIPVCQAMQHAHQKGVIHRDLKPSNILVGLYDGKPVPKVIDFGIAKATGEKLIQRTLVTALGEVIGTPEYMSPEQAEPDQPDIDTRSDIYSLGVLLYELLTGTTPLRRQGKRDVGLLELLRVIREEEPPRPSVRLSTIEELPSIASSRGIEPKRLSGLVRGELDWIVMKCLEKDRTRRYETAGALARDIEHYLHDEPVEASPPGAGYRLGKFARRHRAVLATAAVFMLLLLGGVVVSTWQALRATVAEQKALAERDQKEAARQQARRALNTLTDETVERLMGQQVQLSEQDREFLRRVLALHQEFVTTAGSGPEGLAGIADARFRVGMVHRKLGENREAEAAFRAALDISQKLADDFPGQLKYRRALAVHWNNLGHLLREMGQAERAEQAFRAAKDNFHQLASQFPDQPDCRGLSAKVDICLSLLMMATDRLPRAERSLLASIDTLRPLVAEYPELPEYRSDLATSHNNLGYVRAKAGRPREAEAAYRTARDLEQQLVADFPGVPEYRRMLAGSHANLSIMLRQAGRPREAEEAIRASSALYAQLVADFPGVPGYRSELATSQNNLGDLLSQTGRPREAEEAFRTARDFAAQLVDFFPAVPDYRGLLAVTLGNLAYMRSDRKDYAAARSLLEQALSHLQAALKAYPRHPEYLQTYRENRSLLLRVLNGLGDHGQLAEMARQLARLDVDPANDAYDAACALSLGVHLAARDAALPEAKRRELAQAYAERALVLLREAVKHGYNDATHMRKDNDLDSLRARADFQVLVMDLELPVDPFATSADVTR